MWKYSDDTVIVGCMVNGNEGEYISLWQDFAKYCRSNKLQLNTFKTKEIVADLRRNRPHPTTLSVEGMEVVRSYKYLGLQLDAGLEWLMNTIRCFSCGALKTRL